MTQSRDHFFITHTRTIVALLFGLSFSVVVAYATPPGSAYTPGETLDPTCAPGDTNCTVSVGATLTFSTGLTNTANTITNNLSTGVSGGQSVIGGTASGNDLTLSSTAHATKGKIIFGTSAYDEVNNRLGIGTVSPDEKLVIQGENVGNTSTYLRYGSGALSLGGDMGSVSGVPRIDFKDVTSGDVRSRMGYVNNRGIVISNYRTGLSSEAIFFEHSADEHSLMVVYGVSAYGIQTRIGIGTDAPSSRLDVVSNNLGTTQTTASGIALSNTHTALNGLQQMSPALRWSGHGWKTDAVAGSQDVEFRAYVTPVQGTANPTGYLGFGSSINGGAYNDNQLILNSAGNVGIANTSPGYLLHTGSSSTTTGTTVARFENAGGTCDIVPSTAGGITCTSDERLKKNITTLEDTVLDRVLSVRLVEYNLNSESEDTPVHTGVIAQEFEQLFPDLVQTDSQGFKSVSYVGLIPYVTKAVQEIHMQMVGINDMEIENTWRDSLVAWFANASNHITRIFTGEICLTDTDGTSECLNKQELGQLKQLLNQQPGEDDLPPDESDEIEESDDSDEVSEDELPADEDTTDESELPPPDPLPPQDPVEPNADPTPVPEVVSTEILSS